MTGSGRVGKGLLIGTATWPSADFSTVVALEAYFDPAVGVEDDGHRVAVEQRFIQRFLALVNPLFLVLDTLATPRVTQPVGGRSNG